jgi:hypothetical protein
MKKYMAICVTLVALAWGGVAAAATPQGKLTGSGTYDGFDLVVVTTVIDGGTSYVGLENDRSGNCSGDAGLMVFNNFAQFGVLCAHYVAQSRDGNGPKMRVATIGQFPGQWIVWRFTDGSGVGQPDKIATGTTSSFEEAVRWVNTGAIGSGHLSSSWSFATVTGNYSIIP